MSAELHLRGLREVPLHFRGVRLYVEPHLGWESYQIRFGNAEPALIFGVERYAQFVWQVETSSNVLATDPGPLDAWVS